VEYCFNYDKAAKKFTEKPFKELKEYFEKNKSNLPQNSSILSYYELLIH